MSSIKAEPVLIAGAANVSDDPAALEQYSRDESFISPAQPALVIKPGNADEVQQIVRWANRTGIPLVAVSSGGPHTRGDTIPAAGGAVVLDLSRMDRIIRIDRRNRMVMLEPGATFGQVQPELVKAGMRLSTPLLPRRNKSVVASFLEREPIIVPRYHWEMTEPLRSLGIVWGNGEKLVSGDAGDHAALEEQWQRGLAQNYGSGPFQVDYYRLLSGAQGTMGIVTWAAIKCELLPTIHKLFFVAAQKPEDLFDFTYKLLWARYGDELLILNNTNLARMTGVKAQELPPWVLLLGIAGREWMAAERVAYQEKDISEWAKERGLKLQRTLPGVRSAGVLKTLMAPAGEPYWKQREKGGCEDIFFLTTLDKTPGFMAKMASLATAEGYPSDEFGIYMQPVVQGTGCHCEFSLPFDPSSEAEVSQVKRLESKASQALMDEGAFFSRPYGAWSDMAYARDKEGTAVLRKLKAIFDPNNVMNPGKLCFQKET